MSAFITRHEAIRQSPAVQKLLEWVSTMAILKNAVRIECFDKPYGDYEIRWEIDGEQVAEGYFGGSVAIVTVTLGDEYSEFNRKHTGEEARKMRYLGTLAPFSR